MDHNNFIELVARDLTQSVSQMLVEMGAEDGQRFARRALVKFATQALSGARSGWRYEYLNLHKRRETRSSASFFYGLGNTQSGHFKATVGDLYGSSARHSVAKTTEHKVSTRKNEIFPPLAVMGRIARHQLGCGFIAADHWKCILGKWKAVNQVA